MKNGHNCIQESLLNIYLSLGRHEYFHSIGRKPSTSILLVERQVILNCMEGFHVTSYQADFTSHHTRDHHVGILLTRSSIGNYNKMSPYFLLSPYRNYK